MAFEDLGFNIVANVDAGDIDKFTKKLDATSSAASKLDSVMGSAGNAIDGFINNIQSKIHFIENLSSRVKELVEISADYTENINKLGVSLGSYTEEAVEYAQKVQDALGIDKSEWIDYQGTFASLTKGFGLQDKEVQHMSQQLTQLAYDYSSLYNDNVSEAFTKLNSAMAGQQKGLLLYGNAVNNATMQEYLEKKGIDAKVSSLDMATKERLRYLVLMENAKEQGVWNDTARTITSTANQIRLLNSQVIQLKREFGNIASLVAQKILPFVTQILRVVVATVGAVARLLGFKDVIDDFSQFDGISGLEDDAEGAADGIDKATKAAKKFQKYLAPFDEINQIPAPKENTKSGSSGTGGLTGIDLDVLNAGYDFLDGMKGDIDEVKRKLETFFDPFKRAWERKGTRVTSAFNYALENIKGLISTVSTSWKNAWLMGQGQGIVEDILDITGNILYTVGEIAKKTKTAWEYNNTGDRIVRNILKIVREILGIVKDVTKHIEDLFTNADFKPMVSSIENLSKAFLKLGKALREKIEWAMDTIFDPLAKWSIEKGAPWLVNALAKAIGILADNLGLMMGVFAGMKVVTGIAGTLTSIATNVASLGEQFFFASEGTKRFSKAISRLTGSDKLIDELPKRFSKIERETGKASKNLSSVGKRLDAAKTKVDDIIKKEETINSLYDGKINKAFGKSEVSLDKVKNKLELARAKVGMLSDEKKEMASIYDEKVNVAIEKGNTKLNTAKSKIDAAKESVSKIAKEEEGIQSKYLKHIDKLNETPDIYDEIGEKLAEYQQNLDNLGNMKQEYSGMDKRRKEAKKLKEEIAKLRTQTLKEQQDAKRLEGIYEELSKSGYHNTNETIFEMNEKLAENAEKMSKAKSKVASLETEYKELASIVDGDVQKVIEEQNGILQQHSQKLQLAKADVMKLENEYAELSSNKEIELSSILDDYNKALSDHSTELASAKQKVADLELEYASAEYNLGTLEAEQANLSELMNDPSLWGKENARSMSDIFSNLKEKYASFADDFKESGGLFGGLKEKLLSVKSVSFSDIAKSLIEGIKSMPSKIKGMGSAIVDSFKGIFSKVANLWKFTIESFGSYFANIFTAFTQGGGVLPTIARGFEAIIEPIVAIGSTVAGAVAIIGTLIAAIVAVYKESKEFRDGVKALVGNIWEVIKTAADAFFGIQDELFKGFFGVVINQGIKPLWEQIKLFVKSAGVIILNLLNGVLPVITKVAKIVIKIVKPIAKIIGFVAGLAVTALLKGLQGIVGVLNILLANGFFKWLSEKAKGLFDWISGWLDKAIDSMSEFGKNIADGIKPLKDMAESMLNFFKNAWNSVLEFFGIHSPSKTTEDMAGNLVAGIVNGLKELPGKFKKKFTDAWDAVKNYFANLSIKDWFEKNVKNKALNGFTNIKKSFKEKFGNAWQGIKDAFKWSTIKEFFSNLWEKIKGIFTKLGTKVGNAIGGAFKTVINGIIGTVEKTLNWLVDKINKVIPYINTILPKSKELTPLDHFKFTRLASGGAVNEGQMFVAREAGPELVGSIGNTTTVMNNGQIVEAVSAGVAQAVSGVMRGTSGTSTANINIVLDGKVIANTVYREHNKRVAMTGMSPLNI